MNRGLRLPFDGLILFESPPLSLFPERASLIGMETKKSMSNSQRMREFYLPAMSVLSAVPGPFERFVTAHLNDRSQNLVGKVTNHPSREFYVPGTAVLSKVPSRVERMTTGILRNHDIPLRVNGIHHEIREFYLPGTPRFVNRRR